MKIMKGNLLKIGILVQILNQIQSQFSGGSSLFSLPWGNNGQSNYPTYGKPIRPSPFGYGSPLGTTYGQPGPIGGPVTYDDDPLPLDSAERPPPNPFPAKLPIKAPNGVVEIYNRVVDDLIKKLKVDFGRHGIDPMSVVVRTTPPGPVRVPGHMQKRPYRRPGAALYRSNDKATSKLSLKSAQDKLEEWLTSASNESEGVGKKKQAQAHKEESPRFKRATKGETDVDKLEPVFDEYPASDENLSEEGSSTLSTTDKPKVASGDDDDEVEVGGKSDILQNRKGNPEKPEGGAIFKEVKPKEPKTKTATVKHRTKKKKKIAQPSLEEDPDDDPPEIDDGGSEEEQDDDDEYDRPPGGYYPQDGAPVVPAKPNAELHGLGRMIRASDVTVGVDARSAVVTARLLVGPLVVHINDSVEPTERGVKATIPELEAEIIMLERHGVIFLQRFTLDRVYGQDIEISVPKIKPKGDKKRQDTSAQASGFDPMHPAAIQRYQTKMGAHISMEVVKLLRSGNLRLNIMRTAQGAMTKLRLPLRDDKESRPRKKKRSKGKKKRTKKGSMKRRQ